MENRTWLVFANRNMCDHATSLQKDGFVYWKKGRVKMSIGDIVYLYMSDTRHVRFKTLVVDTECKRGDCKYWVAECPSDLTFKLKLVEEYNGDELNDDVLRKHGFNGGRSIERPMCNNSQLFSYIGSVFAHNSLANIIEEVCHTAKSQDLVRRIIPILVRWAKQGLTANTYGNLINELGYSAFRGLSRQLGYVDDIFKELIERTGEEIPTLNALVKSKSTGLPSAGFSYVYSSYDKMSQEEKQIFVAGLNAKAVEYDKWDWVLLSLGLTESVIDITANEAKIRSGKLYGSGGEGDNHKKLKEYIYNHPESIGVNDFKRRHMEYILLSGDRLDVYFELNNGVQIAVEIKSISSSDADVMRGLFQCVKYKSVLDAESKVLGIKPQNVSMLVVGGKMSIENMKIQEALGICVLEIEVQY